MPPESQDGPLLIEWAKATIVDISWEDALLSAVNVSALLSTNVHHGPDAVGLEFTVPRFSIYRVICERLEMLNRPIEAVACLHEMKSDLARGTSAQHDWGLGEFVHTIRHVCEPFPSDFKRRCRENLDWYGDAAMDNRRHGEALKYYLAALSIQPANTQGFFIMESKVCAARGLWDDALDNADKAGFIVLRKSSRANVESSGDRT